MSKKAFAKGMFLGTAIGAIAALFVSHKKADNIKKNVNHYTKEVETEVKKAWENIDIKNNKTYKELVAKITQSFAEVKKLERRDIIRIKNRLHKKWHLFAKSITKKSE